MRRLYLTIITLVTIACVIVGSVSHAIGFAVKAGRFFGRELFQESEEDMTKNYNDAGTFRSIDIDVDVANVIIRSGSGYDVSFTGQKELEPEVERDGDKLKIKQKGKGKLTASFGLNRKNELTITLPEGAELKDLDAEIEFGNCKFDGIDAEKAELTLKAGNIEVKGGGVQKLSLDANAGNIEVDGCELDKAEIRADMGNIKLNVPGEFRDISCNADLGNIQAELETETDDMKLRLETDLGNIKVNGSKVSGHYNVGEGSAEFTAKSDMGNVEVKTGK